MFYDAAEPYLSITNNRKLGFITDTDTVSDLEGVIRELMALYLKVIMM